jgi:hypothetical protein
MGRIGDAFLNGFLLPAVVENLSEPALGLPATIIDARSRDGLFDVVGDFGGVVDIFGLAEDIPASFTLSLVHSAVVEDGLAMLCHVDLP